jgi:hypothetical protein
MRDFSSTALVALMPLLGLAACAGADTVDDAGNLEAVSAAVIGGTNDNSTTGSSGAVIRFTDNGSGVVSTECSGVKIGPRRFLTAAHCVNNWNGRFGRGIRVTNSPTNPPSGGDQLNLTQVYVHPTFHIPQFESGPMFDVALMDVDADSPNIPQASISPTQPRIGDMTRLIGFGSGRKARADAPAIFASEDIVGVDELWARTTHIIWRGTPSGEPGDSGAPLFAAPDYTQVAGIVSGWDRTGFSGMGRIYSLRQWVANPTANFPPSGSQVPAGYLINAGKPACLTSWGTETARYMCNNGTNTTDPQYWTAELAGTYDGVAAYRLRNGLSGLCLGIRGNSLGSGAKTEQQTCGTNSTYQKWKVVSVGSVNLFTGGGDTVPGYNYNQLFNVGSGKCLDSDGGVTDPETRVVQRNCRTLDLPRTNTQAWIFSR